MVLFLSTDNLALWFAANFLNGAGNALRWVVSDALVTGMAPPARRGRILGIYESVLGGCLLAAPFLLSLTGSAKVKSGALRDLAAKRLGDVALEDAKRIRRET